MIQENSKKKKTLKCFCRTCYLCIPTFKFLFSSSSTHFRAIILWIPITFQETSDLLSWWKNSKSSMLSKYFCWTLSRNHFLYIGIPLTLQQSKLYPKLLLLRNIHFIGTIGLTYHSTKALKTDSLCPISVKRSPQLVW